MSRIRLFSCQKIVEAMLRGVHDGNLDPKTPQARATDGDEESRGGLASRSQVIEPPRNEVCAGQALPAIVHAPFIARSPPKDPHSSWQLEPPTPERWPIRTRTVLLRVYHWEMRGVESSPRADAQSEGARAGRALALGGLGDGDGVPQLHGRRSRVGRTRGSRGTRSSLTTAPCRRRESRPGITRATGTNGHSESRVRSPHTTGSPNPSWRGRH